MFCLHLIIFLLRLPSQITFLVSLSRCLLRLVTNKLRLPFDIALAPCLTDTQSPSPSDRLAHQELLSLVLPHLRNLSHQTSSVGDAPIVFLGLPSTEAVLLHTAARRERHAFQTQARGLGSSSSSVSGGGFLTSPILFASATERTPRP